MKINRQEQRDLNDLHGNHSAFDPNRPIPKTPKELALIQTRYNARLGMRADLSNLATRAARQGETANGYGNGALAYKIALKSLQQNARAFEAAGGSLVDEGFVLPDGIL